MGLEKISGSVAVLGDFISSDVVLPARYSFLPPEEMAEHVLEELGPGVNARIRAHTILVTGEAFGYGTGRESPSRALRAAGIKALIGVSFSRMFFRNAVNNGLLVLECELLVRSGIYEGESVEIDVSAGMVRYAGRNFPVAPVPSIVQAIIAAGSLIDYGRSVVANSRRH